MLGTQTGIVANRYHVVDTIGQGGMGIVYLAQDRLTQQPVALKSVMVAANDLAFNSQDLDADNPLVALAHEFRTLAGLRHPHIISVLDYGFDAERKPFFTMQYLQNAQTILQAANTRSIRERVQLILPVLSALDYLHKRGMLHRDLKPGNVLVTNTGEVRVLDFGLSATLERAKGQSGTLWYMAPEIFRGQGASVASDLYSVGVLLYEMLTGVKPFENDSLQGLLQDILKQPPDLMPIEALADMGDHLLLILGRLLSKDPQDRYGSALATQRELCAALEMPLPAEDDSLRESYLQAATFVGREAELNMLTDALKNAQAGQGGSFLIAGESGVGKSRLMDEVRTQALVSGVRVLRGGAVETGGLPYQLWRNIARQLVLSTPNLSELDASVLKAMVPDLGVLLGRDVPDAPELTGETYRTRLRLAFTEMLKQQTEAMLLLLDDLQWAGEALSWLTPITEMAKERSWLIVGTYRSDEAPHLPEQLPQAQRMALPRLQDDDIRRLSESILGQVNTRAEVVELLANESEGNAFFIVEALRTLAVEAGRIDDIGKVTLPESVITEGMLNVGRRRLQRLPAADQPLIQAAAVAGRVLDFAILQQIDSERDYDDWLLRCQETAILEVTEGDWRFAHDKIRESILTDLDAAQVPHLHRNVAEAIETAYPDDPNYHEALLNHWHIAGDLDKELHYLDTVTDNMVQIQGTYETAQTLLENALNRLAPDDPRCVPILNNMAHMQHRLANYATCIAYAQRARQLAESVGDRKNLAKSLKIHANAALFQGDYDQATALYEQSLDISEQFGDERGIASTINNLAIIAKNQGDLARALALYERSLEAFQRTHHQQGMAISLNNLAIIVKNQGDYARSILLQEQALSIRQQIGDRHGIASSLYNLAIVAKNQGDYARATALHEQSMPLFQQLGDQYGIAISLNQLGNIAADEGDYARATELHQQSMALKQQLGDQRGIATSLTHLGWISFLAGHEPEAQNFIQSLTILQTMRARDVELLNLVGFAAVYHDKRQFVRSADLLSLVKHHPVANPEIEQRVTLLSSQLEAVLPPDELQAAFERGKALDLDTVVQDLLAEFGEGA